MTERTCVIAFFCVLLGFKLILALWAGAALFPDSGDYTLWVESIQQGAPYLQYYEIGAEFHHSVMRSAGYPVFLLIMDWLWPGENSHQLVIYVQCFVSAGVLTSGFALQRRILGHTWSDAVYFVLALFSSHSLYDLAILTDSLSSAAYALTILYIAGVAVGAWRFSIPVALCLGCAVGWSITMRPVNIYFLLIPLMGLVLLLFTRSVARKTLMIGVVLFAAGVALPVQTHLAWNESRTGVRFIDNVGPLNWLWPVFNIKKTGLADPFTSDSRIDRLARETGGVSYTDQGYVLTNLIREGQTMQELGAVTQQKMFDSIAAYPFAYVVSIFDNMDFPNMAGVLFDPRHNMRRFTTLGPLRDSLDPIPGGRQVLRDFKAEPSLLGAIDLILLNLLKLGSILFLAAMVIGAPVLAIRRLRKGERVTESQTLLFLWLSFFCVVGAYSLIHLEERMLMPVTAAGQILALVVVSSIIPWLIERLPLKHKKSITPGSV